MYALPWEDHRRAHRWGFGKLRDDDRYPLSCSVCGQTRLVWKDLDAAVIRYGCARVPLWYRLLLRRRGGVIPPWDCNATPPWVWRQPKLDPRYFATTKRGNNP